MKSQLRHLVANALYSTKAYLLPAVCERFGLESGTPEEAFSSKRQYVMRRLEKFSDEKVINVAKSVVRDFPDDELQAAIESLEEGRHLVTDLSRHHLAEALDAWPLAGKQPLLEMLRKHFPVIDQTPSYRTADQSYTLREEETLADDINRHAVLHDDWANSEILKLVGFLTGSQAKLFQFLEDVVHPIRRDEAEQAQIVDVLNPILQRDGFRLVASHQISGYPAYRVQERLVKGAQPADALISQILISYDESGVHEAWRKALERRASDPEGAITAAKTLLETVCKHIIDEAKLDSGENDDLPKLYSVAAEYLNLAPSQHTEKVFKSILGNCQAVVGNLANLRNKLGDSHGKGKLHVKPRARHAELAVNLAGSMAMFLISTWNARKT